jgi:hypothetical protein
MTIPELPAGADAAITGWMKRHGWTVLPARREKDPDAAFYVWQEDVFRVGRPHALWVEEPVIGHLPPDELIRVLDREGVAEEIRINFRVRIQQRGAEYRVSPVPRRSGEQKRQE